MPRLRNGTWTWGLVPLTPKRRSCLASRYTGNNSNTSIDKENDLRSANMLWPYLVAGSMAAVTCPRIKGLPVAPTSWPSTSVQGRVCASGSASTTTKLALSVLGRTPWAVPTASLTTLASAPSRSLSPCQRSASSRPCLSACGLPLLNVSTGSWTFPLAFVASAAAPWSLAYRPTRIAACKLHCDTPTPDYWSLVPSQPGISARRMDPSC